MEPSPNQVATFLHSRGYHMTAEWVREVYGMSRLQIRGSEDDRVRAELRERIGSLNLARECYLTDKNSGDGNADESRREYHQQLSALYYALTGYQPTEEELKQLAAG